MDIQIKLLDEHFTMEATNESGNKLIMDASENIGGQNNGMRPMQVLLAALGGCSVIDVLNILKKQRKKYSSFEITLDGDREQLETYSLYRNIVIHFKINGEISADQAKKAIDLSLEKYCSVAKTLEPTASIISKLTLNGKEEF
ncbi:MAG: OsmC family protein [Saprospiraceae bacterium]|nr:OsmC family protein [Candidatus Vicinibacter proximus]MBL7822599.1 OsmC family protein [Saprospiraceae bacterium]MCC6842357.1 OsmC family protein [Saprospiraceae bacterium]HRG33924.1 OsmC family protein [Saprospiraceae bacterium]